MSMQDGFEEGVFAKSKKKRKRKKERTRSEMESNGTVYYAANWLVCQGREEFFRKEEGNSRGLQDGNFRPF